MVTRDSDLRKVQLTIEDSVAELRLTDPSKRNCFSRGLAAGLYGSTTEMISRDDVHAMAITAEGPTFSAGADLELVRGNDPDAMNDVHDYRRPVFRWVRDGQLPVIRGDTARLWVSGPTSSTPQTSGWPRAVPRSGI